MIEIINQQKRYSIDLNRFKILLKTLIMHYNLQNPEISLVFANNKAVRELNHRFLNKNTATDVLSFPVGEKGADGKFYLGDIIISVPIAYRECLQKRDLLERKLEHLTLHGFLHLMGFEHFKGIEEEEKKIRSSLFKESKHGN